MLTKRQKQVLDYIKKYISRYDYAPSLEEIKKHLRLSSVSTAHYHVQALKDMGYLQKEVNQPRALNVISKQKLVYLPLLGKIAAGEPIEAIEDKESVAVPQSKIKPSNNYFALRVAGKSMVEENIDEGDIILVKQQNTANNGDRVIALLENNEATLKKFYKLKNKIKLQPANKAFDPLFVNNVQIQGIVVDVIKQPKSEHISNNINLLNSSSMLQAKKVKRSTVTAVQKPKFNNYLDEIFDTSFRYLTTIMDNKELDTLISKLKRIKCSTPEGYIFNFNKFYCEILKIKYQSSANPNHDPKLINFINDSISDIKLIWGDCLKVLKKMASESIHLMVTSPPYYNAREYSQWNNINEYLDDMKAIIKESYRVLDNHRVWVFNVGDIFDNPNTITKSVWGKTRIPLGAYFVKIFEECGFTFVDDIIWDKGEVQSERHKSGDKPYSFYQYPMNCYEHLLIFHKHRLDLYKYPCPRCGSLKVNGNTQSEPGLQSWECKNESCFERSASNRGKRFSLKTNIVQSSTSQNGKNKIDSEFIKRWRRDIIRFSPVIKINSKGRNIAGHSAPFPEDIPEMAIKYFTYAGEKVLDPFSGSFTTGIVAKKLKRIGIGIDINKKLFRNVVKRRIEKEFNTLWDKSNFSEMDLE